MAHLVEDNALDPSYVEDFLLTYRTFVKNPLLVTENLLNWFSDPLLRDKVSSIQNQFVEYFSVQILNTDPFTYHNASYIL